MKPSAIFLILPALLAVVLAGLVGPSARADGGNDEALTVEQEIDGTAGGVVYFEAYPNGQLINITTARKTVIWHVDGRLWGTLDHPGDACCTGISTSLYGRAGGAVAVGYADGTVRHWMPTNGQLTNATTYRYEILHTIEALPNTAIRRLATITLNERNSVPRPYGFWAVGDGQSELKSFAWPNSDMQAANYTGHNKPITAFAPIMQSSKLASGDESGRVLVWDFNTRELQVTISAHRKPVTAIVCSPDASQIATVSREEKRLRIFDVATGRKSAEATLRAEPTALMWNATPNRLLVGDASGKLHIYDPAQLRTPLNSYDVADAPLAGVAMLTGGRRFLIATADANPTKIYALPVPRPTVPGRGRIPEFAYPYTNGEKVGLIDESGRKVLEATMFDMIAMPVHGYVLARYEGLWGLLDSNREWVIPPSAREFEHILPLAPDRIRLLDPATGRLGIQDAAGKVIVEPAYVEIDTFFDGMARVKTAEIDCFGYVAMDGQLKVEPQYRHASPFGDGIAMVVFNPRYDPNAADNHEQLWAIDRDGNRLFRIPCGPMANDYDFRVPPLDCGLIAARLDNFTTAFYDRTGTEKMRIQGHAMAFVDGFTRVRGGPHGRGVKIYDENLRAIGDEYAFINAFKHGMAVVSDGARYGFIDRSGRLIIPMKFAAVQYEFTGALALVKDADGTYYYIDKRGRKIADYTQR